MYAVVRQNNYDPKRLARAGDELAEFQELHAAQLGYAGNLTIEMQPGQWLTATLWDTEAHAAAARETLGEHVQRLLSPLMTGPSELLGMGVVVASDLVRVGSN
jgi:hypothetical protein